MEPGAASDTPTWHVVGDWFDVCRCDIPCPCEFAQPPTDNWCEGVLAWNIREGNYGDVRLDGLSLVGVATFEGNIWAGAKATLGLFIDERADESQREALQQIFSGQAGGFPADFAELIEEVRGIEFVPIEFEVADDLAYWRAEIPGKVVASAEALGGPMTPPGERVQLINPPGSEVGPSGTVATWGRATADRAEAFGFRWEWDGKSSKHIPFDWTGP
jgi:hypothetical protein